MAWKTIIENIEASPSSVATVVAVFVDEVRGLKEQRRVQVANPTDENIKQALRRERDGINAVYAVSIIPGELDIDSVTLPPPDPAMQEFQTYAAARNFLNVVRLQVADGLATPEDEASALSALKTAYKPEFLGRY